MTENQIGKCRQRLERFLLDLLEPIGRSERRHWGELYVRGLLQDGDRKSIEPMAARLPDGNVQAMQQFVGQSPWEWEEVWARLGKRMTRRVGTRFGVGGGRHRVSQTRRGFRGCRSAVFRDAGENGQLPGGGESPPCGRAGECGFG